MDVTPCKRPRGVRSTETPVKKASSKRTLEAETTSEKQDCNDPSKAMTAAPADETVSMVLRQTDDGPVLEIDGETYRIEDMEAVKQLRVVQKPVKEVRPKMTLAEFRRQQQSRRKEPAESELQSEGQPSYAAASIADEIGMPQL
mmetsp:Transcript_61878/g.109943  ORF Transcript_61878/g.109943 Transcript_61878/m.109943 type:complete len:144 (-) Transcript_61878:72-503(-)|eukprot:CAMPEP_0197660348 /NCGR_PEP_ID=MMETSP1338-20131121/50796_1 /TAXON_ID=43686 ORGANISM="Pelagodinium beii, Strain RCC1491" /NCGR_SAMPLE_ID=MMETSP1338 /ASSEMBLY_ACC=CAM_ASM_000754 /LENGTH=143 /DNA_ID=CAMNT_0043237683 /DNA_START=37 /DNA_END=468 /DNA_ORIENTATION=+